VLAQPDIAFQKGNPLLLTTEGEFVIKNLVMIAAGLVLLGRTRDAEPDI
jgi:putative oxidoreductase